MRSLMGSRRARRRALSFFGIVVDVAVLVSGMVCIERSPTRLELERELSATRQAMLEDRHVKVAVAEGYVEFVAMPSTRHVAFELVVHHDSSATTLSGFSVSS